MRIDTQLGKGSTITVYLPRAESAAAPQPRNAETAELLPVQDATVLVVDDDRDVRELTVACLDSLGYRNFAADSGRAALALIENLTTVDLLLVDIAMPEMNGVQVAHAVLAKRPDLPILYMTGYVGSARPDGIEQGLLKKPFTVAELATKVREALHSNRQTRRSSNIVQIRSSLGG